MASGQWLRGGQVAVILDRDARITSLIDSTFNLSLKELRSFLDRECANDPDLRAEVERRIFERETVAGRGRQSSAQRAGLAPGDVVAERYRITRLLGRGGMGEVYEAHDLLLEEAVALKTLRADLVQNESFVQRFQQEITLARKVTHPNVCRIYEVGIRLPVTPTADVDEPTRRAERPLLFFAMELLQGETLLDRIRAGRLKREEAFPIAVQLAEGLHAAHRAGIVHADFKSANVILVPAPAGVRAVITDFGVARLDPSRLVVDDTRTLTDNMRLAGTLGYMSPEQIAGEDLTTASDLYSFGIVLFEMASAERPFDDRDLIKSVMLRAADQPKPIRAKVPDIDPRWEAAINRCLQRDPKRRFASAGELAAWFRGGAWRPVRYWTRQEWTRNLAAALVVLLAALGGWMWAYRPYRPPPDAQLAYDRGVDALHSMAYETARKALEQTVAIDPAFALAHASLARAYDELDYTDRAKDAMLRAIAAAQESRLTADAERRLRALQFMVQRDYERAAPLVRQVEAEATGTDRAAAALESGWLAQQMENSGAAAAAFERALTLEPSYAAAKLRLGFLFGRQGGKDDMALSAFKEAEQLYRAGGNTEGVTQTLLEQANLLDRRNREREALPIIEQALTVARGVGNRYQEIRLRFLQATAFRDLGDTTRAADLVREAIDVALAENMDNLAATGQIDLGNIYLRRGDLRTAEPILRRALDTARRGRVRRIEARALVSLGSMCEQDHRPAEARPLIEASLAFYRQAGYERESLQAAILLGGVLRQLGQNEDGIRILRDTLPGAVRLQDRRLEAQLRERIAENLRDLGDWPAAIAEYTKTGGLYGAISQGEEARVQAAELEWRVGRSEEALRLLRGAQEFQTESKDQGLLFSITSARAEIAYSQGRFGDARALVRKALATTDSDSPSSRPLTFLTALIQIRFERDAEGLPPATRVVNELEQAGLASDAAFARLAIAEALATGSQRAQSETYAREALSYFEPRRVWEAAVRGHLIAARMSPERREVDLHQAGARAALAQLRSVWGAPAVEAYLTRPDIRQLSSAANLKP